MTTENAIKIDAIVNCILSGAHFCETSRLASEKCDSDQIAEAFKRVCVPSPTMEFHIRDAKALPEGYMFVPDDGNVPLKSEVGARFLDIITEIIIGTGRWYNPQAYAKYVESSELSPEGD